MFKNNKSDKNELWLSICAYSIYTLHVIGKSKAHSMHAHTIGALYDVCSAALLFASKVKVSLSTEKKPIKR